MAKPRARRVASYQCHRCGWTWMPRKADIPTVCPHCHSTRWWNSRSDEDEALHWMEFNVERHAFDMVKALQRVIEEADAGEPRSEAVVQQAKAVLHRALRTSKPRRRHQNGTTSSSPGSRSRETSVNRT